jgi:hypothetical protein
MVLTLKFLRVGRLADASGVNLALGTGGYHHPFPPDQDPGVTTLSRGRGRGPPVFAL